VKGGEQKPGSGSSIPTLAEGATPLDPLEGIVRDPGCDEVGRRSEQAVAALDVGIEEAERSAGSSASIQRATLQSSTAIGLTSTP
jgi:hypothetical protein